MLRASLRSMRPPQVPPGDRQSRLASGPLFTSDQLIVRVLPDVPAIDKTFDYLVPDAVRDQVRVGDVVRIEIEGIGAIENTVIAEPLRRDD